MIRLVISSLRVIAALRLLLMTADSSCCRSAPATLIRVEPIERKRLAPSWINRRDESSEDPLLRRVSCSVVRALHVKNRSEVEGSEDKWSDGRSSVHRARTFHLNGTTAMRPLRPFASNSKTAPSWGVDDKSYYSKKSLYCCNQSFPLATRRCSYSISRSFSTLWTSKSRSPSRE